MKQKKTNKNQSFITKLFKQNKKRFTLNVGDEGAVLTLFSNQITEKRLFAPNKSEEDIEKFTELLNQNPNVPISMLIDVQEQAYVLQSLPGVSSFSIKQLVNRKLARDFGKNDLKGYIFVSRSKTGRGDWNYMFISTPLVSPLVDWINYMLIHNNPIGDICLLPIEIYNLIKKINLTLFPKLTKHTPLADRPSEWQLIMTNDKVGGFRQVAFKNSKIAFTRLIAIDNMESPAFIAGSIEQEIANSIEYLKRISYKDTDKLDIYIITSSEIKNFLVKIKFKAERTFVFTPYEAAERAEVKNTASGEDRSSDVVIAANFADLSKPILTIKEASIVRLKLFQIAIKYINLPFVLIVPTLVCLAALIQYDILKIKREINYSLAEKAQSQSRLDNIKSKSGDLNNIKKINDVLTLYKILQGNKTPLLEIISKFNEAKTANILAKSFKLEINQNTQDPKNTARSDVQTITIGIEFINTTNSYQELFEKFDAFINKLKKVFDDYTVEYSTLTEKISFSENNNKVIPVQITITGPKTKRGPN